MDIDNIVCIWPFRQPGYQEHICLSDSVQVHKRFLSWLNIYFFLITIFNIKHIPRFFIVLMHKNVGVLQASRLYLHTITNKKYSTISIYFPMPLSRFSVIYVTLSCHWQVFPAVIQQGALLQICWNSTASLNPKTNENPRKPERDLHINTTKYSKGCESFLSKIKKCWRALF